MIQPVQIVLNVLDVQSNVRQFAGVRVFGRIQQIDHVTVLPVLSVGVCANVAVDLTHRISLVLGKLLDVEIIADLEVYADRIDHLRCNRLIRSRLGVLPLFLGVRQLFFKDADRDL